MRRLVAVFLLMLASVPAHALLPSEMLADSGLEARARALSAQLRCMVCQNQSIDDSDAELARDLRLLVRERLLAGDSDAEVLDFLHRRYGDFVLLKPPLRAGTLLLWASPFAVLLGGATLLVLRRRRALPVAEAPLSEADRLLLARLVRDEAS